MSQSKIQTATHKWPAPSKRDLPSNPLCYRNRRNNETQNSPSLPTHRPSSARILLPTSPSRSLLQYQPQCTRFFLFCAELKSSALPLSGLALRREDFPLAAFFWSVVRGGEVSNCGLAFGRSAYLCWFSIPKELEDEFRSSVMASLDLVL